MARDHSGPMPHMHILFSPRRDDDHLQRTPETWFKQRAREGQDPARGGVQPDRSWATKGRLYDVRGAVELLSNAALAREGIELAVSARSLEARGLSRDPARYHNADDKSEMKRVENYRQTLRESGATRYEQLHTYAGWQDHRRDLLTVERQYVKDLARDHVWRFDQSPARTLERQQSMARTLEHAMGERAPTRQPERSLGRSMGRTQERIAAHVQRLSTQTQRLLQGLTQGEELPAGAGVKVRLFDREREQDRGRGLGW